MGNYKIIIDFNDCYFEDVEDITCHGALAYFPYMRHNPTGLSIRLNNFTYSKRDEIEIREMFVEKFKIKENNYEE